DVGMAEGQAIMHITGEIPDISAGKAEKSGGGVDAVLVQPGIAVGGPGVFRDGDDRMVGGGQNIGRIALAAAENGAVRPRDRRAAARSPAVDTENVVRHGHLRSQRYQKNTINQGVWWYRK